MISPHAGSLSDRKDRRSIAVFANLANGAAVIMFGGSLLFFSLSVPLLYFVTVVMSVANAYFLPASTAHIQSLTDMKFYTRLASSREIAMQVGVIGGTLADGPVLRLFPFSVTFAVIGWRLVASALSFMWLPSANAATCANHSYTGLLSNLHNMKEIFSVGHFSVIIALLMVPTLAMQIDNVLISGYVMQELQQNVLSFSMINASYSIGALLAGVTTAQFAKQWPTNIAIPLSLAGMGVAHLLFGLSWCFEVAFVASFLIGITLVPARIMLNSELMTVAGNEFAGRSGCTSDRSLTGYDRDRHVCRCQRRRVRLCNRIRIHSSDLYTRRWPISVKSTKRACRSGDLNYQPGSSSANIVSRIHAA